VTSGDVNRLKEEIGLTSVLDLRSNFEIEQQGVGLVSESGFRYHNVSLITDGGDRNANEQRYRNFTDMGEFYSYLVRQNEFVELIIEALDVIAQAENHPLIFHCSAGKDRSGILAAILLSVLGVADDDIINDYSLSAPYMDVILAPLEAI
jgi:protein-tyrosine phosphatase